MKAKGKGKGRGKDRGEDDRDGEGADSEDGIVVGDEGIDEGERYDEPVDADSDEEAGRKEAPGAKRLRIARSYLESLGATQSQSLSYFSEGRC